MKVKWGRGQIFIVVKEFFLFPCILAKPKAGTKRNTERKDRKTVCAKLILNTRMRNISS